MTADARPGDRPMTATAGGHVPAPSFTAVLRIPRDPAATDHHWPDLWPRRSALELGALDTAPGCARARAHARARAVLREWNTPAEAADDGLTVVSELVTNAVTSTRKHRGAAPVRLWLLGDGASVLILVWDATMPPPVPASTVPGDAEHGRGLTLVAGLSARWGCYYPAGPPGGKVVWALMPPSGRPGDVTGSRAAPLTSSQRHAVEEGAPDWNRAVPARRVPLHVGAGGGTRPHAPARRPRGQPGPGFYGKPGPGPDPSHCPEGNPPQ